MKINHSNTVERGPGWTVDCTKYLHLGLSELKTVYITDCPVTITDHQFVKVYPAVSILITAVTINGSVQPTVTSTIVSHSLMRFFLNSFLHIYGEYFHG